MWWELTWTLWAHPFLSFQGRTGSSLLTHSLDHSLSALEAAAWSVAEQRTWGTLFILSSQYLWKQSDSCIIPWTHTSVAQLVPSANGWSVLPTVHTQALTPAGSALILLLYIQKILLSLLLKHIRNLTIFPPLCYHAGPSQHHRLFRRLVNLTGPCFSPCPRSVCAPHNSWMPNQSVSQMHKICALPSHSKWAGTSSHGGKVVLPISSLWLCPCHRLILPTPHLC